MPAFVLPAGATMAEVVEDVSRTLVEAYSSAELQVLAAMQRRIDRLLPAVEGQALRAAALAQAREDVTQYLAGLTDDLAFDAVQTAIEQGTAAAARQVGQARYLPPTVPYTSTQVGALTAVAFDLRNALDDVKQRILRFDADSYQQLIAGHVPKVLLGVEGKLDAQRNAVAEWLSKGIPGFVDQSGREWAPGSYVEMATRTAVNRGFLEAGHVRMQASGLTLVSILVGAAACRRCAAWAGKILSTDGTTGTVTLPDALTGEPVEVTIAGTLSQARAAGWNHPNCRCQTAAYLPGLPVAVKSTTYNPVLEKATQDQRAMERQLRAEKRELALSPSEAKQRELRASIRETQADLRRHIEVHDLPRMAWREQPQFAHGTPDLGARGSNPAAPRPPATPANPGPTAPRPPAPAPAPRLPDPTVAARESTALPPSPAESAVDSLRSQLTAKTTSVEAAQLAEARHGIPFPDWDGVPAKVGREAVAIVSDLLDAFPARFAKIAGARDPKLRIPPRTMAYVATPRGSTQGSMHFVRATLSEKRLAESGQRNHASGHLLGEAGTWEDSLRHIATHEFVHGLDANVGEKLRQLYSRELRKATEGMPYAEAYAWREANLSKYARTSNAEGVAEVIADALIRGDAAPPFGRHLLPLVRALLEEEL